MGLSIARTIVEMHKGQLRAEKQSGGALDQTSRLKGSLLDF
ncbi:MAG: hypothetical protein WA813_06480 [Beijerinckiaceae bacterium]